MKTHLKKLWRLSQARAIGFTWTSERVNVDIYLTWFGVFLWSAVLAWVIFG